MLDGAVRRIREETDLQPVVGVVLGSGLGGLADEVQDRVEIPYDQIPGWPVSTAVGHAGVLVLGVVDGVPFAVMRGEHISTKGSALTARSSGSGCWRGWAFERSS